MSVPPVVTNNKLKKAEHCGQHRKCGSSCVARQKVSDYDVTHMADTEGRNDSCLSSFDNLTSVEQDGKCLGCSELRLELLKIKTELLSYEKIIRVLQEELCQKNLLNNAEPTVQDDLSDEYFRLQSIQEGWTQSISKNYRKSTALTAI
jgi:hypothetical protein